MATFEYQAVVRSEAGEEHFERGYVVAPCRIEAEGKLKANRLELRELEQIKGVKGLIKAFSADIR